MLIVWLFGLALYFDEPLARSMVYGDPAKAVAHTELDYLCLVPERLDWVIAEARRVGAIDAAAMPGLFFTDWQRLENFDHVAWTLLVYARFSVRQQRPPAAPSPAPAAAGRR